MQLFAFFGEAKNLSPREKKIKSLFQEGTKWTYKTLQDWNISGLWQNTIDNLNYLN